MMDQDIGKSEDGIQSITQYHDPDLIPAAVEYFSKTKIHQSECDRIDGPGPGNIQ